MSDIQSGPCIVCGLRNYPLSYGGPSICPSCDCGQSGPNKVAAQKKEIDRLVEERDQLKAAIAKLGANQRTPGTTEICARGPEFCKTFYEHSWGDCEEDKTICPIRRASQAIRGEGK